MQTHHTLSLSGRCSGLFFVLALSIFWSCPPRTPSERPPSDGAPTEGTPPDPHPEQKAGDCAADAVCVFLSNAQARSCSLLLEQKKGDPLQSVDFHSALRGRSKQQDKKLGIVFLWRKNEALSDSKPAVVLRASSKKAAQTWSWNIVKQTCYDAKGQPLDKPALSVVGP
jgi:hypothetical protein